MNQYLAGTSVFLPIEFHDDDGNPLEVSQAFYRITDQHGQEIVPSTGFDLSANSLEIPASANQLDPLDIDSIRTEDMGGIHLNAVRNVEFELTLQDGNVLGHDLTYVLYPRERLIAGINSFQSHAQAIQTAAGIHDVDVFQQASTAQRVAALEEARERIVQLSFVDISLGQSYLGHGQVINLTQITPREFQTLSERFKAALRKAQVAEANVVLGGGDLIEQMRQQGLTSQTIGETHETYRSATPLTMLVSKVTFRYLSDFLASSKKITRT